MSFDGSWCRLCYFPKDFGEMHVSGLFPLVKAGWSEVQLLFRDILFALKAREKVVFLKD